MALPKISRMKSINARISRGVAAFNPSDWTAGPAISPLSWVLPPSRVANGIDDVTHGIRACIHGEFDGEGVVVGVASRNLENLETHLIVEDELLLAVASGDPLAGETSQPWGAIGGRGIIHIAGGSIGELATAVLHGSGLALSPRYCVDRSGPSTAWCAAGWRS